MAITFDKALGIHDDALLLRSQRAGVLANNIANADTPNYLARDVDFKAILNGAIERPLRQEVTREDHSSELLEPDLAADMMYRLPTQASVDGNTVELHQEMSRYTENAVSFQASYTFLDRKFKGMISAIKGE